MDKSCPRHQGGDDRAGAIKSSLLLRHLFLAIRSRHGPYPLQVPILAHQRTAHLLGNQLPSHQSCTEMHYPIPIRNSLVHRYISRLPHPQLCVSVQLAHDIPPILLHHFPLVANLRLQLAIQFR